MKSLIQKEHITILESVGQWQDAVIASAKPLIEYGFVEPRYVDAIFESTRKHGPYYVLAPEIAMPHASPADGVIKQQISLLVLRKPVRFSPEGFDVRLVFTLAAADHQSHLESLRILAGLFADEVRIAKIIKAATIEEIMSLLNNQET